jgi:hypothetical protein
MTKKGRKEGRKEGGREGKRKSVSEKKVEDREQCYSQ